MSDKQHKVRMPLFPLYSTVKQLVKVFSGLKRTDVSQLITAIHNQTGTPQNPVDWSDPGSWIDERLNGYDAEIAKRIWRDSKQTVNLRYLYGSYLLINSYGLLETDNEGVYQITEYGRQFVSGDKVAIKSLDDTEGLLQLLNILSTKTKAKRADILPEWSEFLLEYSKFGTKGTFNDTLRRRLINLIERGFVDREANSYSLSIKGQKYLESAGVMTENPKREVLNAVSNYISEQRIALKELLSNIHPYQFEHLIRDLLESMGYEDVVVTKEAGDKGVDVTGTIQFGITSVKEVVQVKRTPNSSIGRPILDQLRGALVYHQAIRGTLITLGTVSKGAREGAVYPGAAPITLIDGERLLDLLVEHDVGVKKKPIKLWEVDQAFFEENYPDIEVSGE